ncbi:MAG: DUF1987 domain-containing protein [Opitutales bacterium]
MQAIHIDGTDNTPTVDLDPAAGRLEIRGESYPENVAAFFEPLLESLMEYLEKHDKLDVVFQMVYFNTSSAKFFYDLFLTLEQASKKTAIDVVWYYRADDEIMLEHGEDFQLDFKLPIRLETLPAIPQA